jgi:hypothetical protein
MALSNENWITIGTSIGGSILSAWLTAKHTWKIEQRKGQVRVLDKDSLYVEFAALRKDKQGYYIPGHGRMEIKDMDQFMLIVKQHKKRVGFHCRRIDGIGNTSPIYGLGKVVPL